MVKLQRTRSFGSGNAPKLLVFHRVRKPRRKFKLLVAVLLSTLTWMVVYQQIYAENSLSNLSHCQSSFRATGIAMDSYLSRTEIDSKGWDLLICLTIFLSAAMTVLLGNYCSCISQVSHEIKDKGSSARRFLEPTCRSQEIGPYDSKGNKEHTQFSPPPHAANTLRE